MNSRRFVGALWVLLGLAAALWGFWDGVVRQDIRLSSRLSRERHLRGVGALIAGAALMIGGGALAVHGVARWRAEGGIA